MLHRARTTFSVLTERTLLEKVEAFPDGKINVYRVTIIERDGKEVSRVPEIDKIEPGDKLPAAEDLVKAVAYALWSATDVNKSTTVPGFKRGKLYRSRGKDTSPTPTFVGPVSSAKDVHLADPRASLIKHRGAEQSSHKPQYAGTSQGFSTPERKIKHRGKDQS